jgi:hypothetical protein
MNYSLFEHPLSPEAKYWLGFILADGYLCGNTVNIKLGIKDKDHLQKFFDSLENKSKIYILKDIQTTFGIATSAWARVKSPRLVQQLQVLGIDYRKSLIAKPLIGLEYDIDFWRGVIDGDGSLRIRTMHHKYTYCEVAICGTEAVVQGFANLALLLVPTPHIPKITRRKNIYGFAVGGSRATKLLSLLYYQDCLALNRKQEIAILTKGIINHEYRRYGS